MEFVTRPRQEQSLLEDGRNTYPTRAIVRWSESVSPFDILRREIRKGVICD
jgi:hypothetical protein